MMGIAAIMAFAPTLILMYLILRNYTYPKVEQPFFSDPTLFKLFTLGLGMGVIFFAFTTYLNWRSMVPMILIAVIECLALVVVLNLKRFHGKSDSVFYGYGLGLGMGCSMAFGMIYFLGTAIVGLEEGAIDLAGFIWLFILAASHVFLISAVGTTVGEGVARLKPMEYALQAVLVAVVFNLVLVAAYNNTGEGIMFYVPIVLAFVISVVYFYYIMHVKLSGIIRDVLRMEGKMRKDIPK